jgi:hypothetical protein
VSDECGRQISLIWLFSWKRAVTGGLPALQNAQLFYVKFESDGQRDAICKIMPALLRFAKRFGLDDEFPMTEAVVLLRRKNAYRLRSKALQRKSNALRIASPHPSSFGSE